MNFSPTIIKDAFVVEIVPLVDERGSFARTFCEREFAAVGFHKKWVQMNHSVTLKKGSLRGLHYQLPPYTETKLIRCIRGKVFDVIVDLRKNSPSFLKWVSVELSSANHRMILVPDGVAHGFQTLEDHSELIYHHTAFYTPSAEQGVHYKDRLLDIEWPMQVSSISGKDNHYPALGAEFKGIEL